MRRHYVREDDEPGFTENEDGSSSGSDRGEGSASDENDDDLPELIDS